MTREFKSSFTRYAPNIETIVKNLRRLGFSPNIENVLSYSRGQAHPKDVLRNSSPFVAHFVETTKRLGYDPAAKAMTKDIEEFIAQKCLVTEAHRIEIVDKFYSRFFTHIKNCLQVSGSLEDGSISLDIFTTNYDNVIEQYAASKGIDFFAGYEPTGDGTWHFAPELYEIKGAIKLYKLHGSVTFGMVENRSRKEKKVIESQMGLRMGDVYRGDWRVVDRVMIYGYEKDPSQEPFFDLLYYLKKRLRNVANVLVVGYSFSDRPILNVFKDVMKSSSDEFRIIILDKNASRIKKSCFLTSKSIRIINTPFRNFRRRIRGSCFV